MLARMEAELGLELDRARVAFGRANASWDASLLPAARFLNHFTARTVEDKEHVLRIPGFYALRSGALTALSRLLRSPRKSLLGRPLERWIEARYATSNARLRALRPGLLTEDLYPSRADMQPPFPSPQGGEGRVRGFGAGDDSQPP